MAKQQLGITSIDTLDIEGLVAIALAGYVDEGAEKEAAEAAVNMIVSIINMLRIEARVHHVAHPPLARFLRGEKHARTLAEIDGVLKLLGRDPANGSGLKRSAN
jgi:hypothetical protein